MNIKHLVATGLMTFFAAAIATTGCSVRSGSDLDSDSDMAEDMAEEDISEAAEAVTVAVDCTASQPNPNSGATWSSYSRAATVAAGTVIDAIDVQNTVYDASAYCATAINKRRRENHQRTVKINGVTTVQNVKPYYNAYDNEYVPPYTATSINVSATAGSSACRMCKGLADAKVSGHAGYGFCYGLAPEATGPTTNDVAVGWCPANIGQNAHAAIDGCLNSFEAEQGGGHKGPIVWDSTRNISCKIGVYVDPVTKAKKAGITVDYTYQPRNNTTPNGGNCKVSPGSRTRSKRACRHAGQMIPGMGRLIIPRIRRSSSSLAPLAPAGFAAQTRRARRAPTASSA
jgi:hypothetical protein